jgi:hypothetical protein
MVGAAALAFYLCFTFYIVFMRVGVSPETFLLLLQEPVWAAHGCFSSDDAIQLLQEQCATVGCA